MSDNNNNTPETNPSQNADDNTNTQDKLQEEKKGQETTKKVDTPDSNPEPKAGKSKSKSKSSKSKEDNLLYFKERATKAEEKSQTLEERLNNLDAEFKLTKKTAEVKDVLYNSDINPDFTDLIMDRLLKSDDPSQELQELLEAKPSLKKQAESNKPAGDIGANIGNGKEPTIKKIEDMSYAEYTSTRNNK